MTTKVHAVGHGLGNPLRIHLTGGKVNDIVPAYDLIEGLKADWTIADRAYDADRFIALAEKQGAKPVIPPRSNRLEQREFDRNLYKESGIWSNAFSPRSRHSDVFQPVTKNWPSLSKPPLSSQQA